MTVLVCAVITGFVIAFTVGFAIGREVACSREIECYKEGFSDGIASEKHRLVKWLRTPQAVDTPQETPPEGWDYGIWTCPNNDCRLLNDVRVTKCRWCGTEKSLG